MNRLPGCDRVTRRSEVAVFLSLGLAGVTMIALALVQMTHFVASGDRIAAALSAPPAAVAETPAQVGKAQLTNVTANPVPRTAGQALTPGKV
jgi:hypothetical protein